MPDSTPAPKAPTSKPGAPTKPQIKRAAPRKVASKPQIISRQVFSDFASI